MEKKIIIPIITIIIFITSYYIINLFNYTFTTTTTYLFLLILFIELVVIIFTNKKDSLLTKFISIIAYLFIFVFLIILLLSFYGYDVSVKNNYVIRKSLLDFKPIREISKSPNIFIKSKTKENCPLIDDICS